MINEDVGWYGDNNSRSLLIGGCNDMYGEIFLDGEEQECK